MPEWPAQKKTSLNENNKQKSVERLATPEELAEFGGITPNPVIEAQILALLEAQMDETAPREPGGPLAHALAAGMPAPVRPLSVEAAVEATPI